MPLRLRGSLETLPAIACQSHLLLLNGLGREAEGPWARWEPINRRVEEHCCSLTAGACRELPTLLPCLQELAGRLRQRGEIRGELQSAGCGQDSGSSTCSAAEGAPSTFGVAE